MTRVAPIAPEKAGSKAKELLEIIQKQMGRVPNIFQTMGHSPAVLEGYLNLSKAVDKTSIRPQVREKIALTVGQANQCQYCLSAHTFIGGSLGIKPDEILHARKGESEDPKTSAILKFTKQVVDSKGKVTDQDVKNLKSAGVTDSEIVEIIMVIVLNMFTNYFNIIIDTKVDFPEAPKLN